MGEYQVTDGASTGNTLDIELEDSYGSTSGRSLDFTMKDAIEQLFSEEAAFQDSRSSLLKRGLQDDLTVDAFTFILLVDRLSETLGVSEEDAYSILKQVDESVGLNDVFSREADYFRGLAANFSLNDFKDLRMNKNVQEDVVFNEFEEILTVLDLEDGLVLDSVYTDSADLFRNQVENMTMDDSANATRVFFRSFAESLALNEFEDIIATVKMFETLALSEFYSREADYFRDFSEDLKVSDKFLFLLEKDLLDEALGVVDNDSFTLSKIRNEDVALSSELRKTVAAVRSEDLALDDERSLKFLKEVDEDLSIDSEYFYRLDRTLAETVSLNSVLNTESDFFRSYSEDFVLDEEVASRVIKFRTVEEDLVLDDSIQRLLGRPLNEVLSVGEQLDFFFSEGPGASPYYVRNSIFEANSLNNSFEEVNSVQNAFKTLKSININLGNQNQT